MANYGIKIGREESISISEQKDIECPELSIEYESSYYIGPRDWSEEVAPKVETIFCDPNSKRISHSLLTLNDLLKSPEDSSNKSFYDLDPVIIRKKVDSYLENNYLPSFEKLVFQDMTEVLTLFYDREIDHQQTSGPEFFAGFENFITFLRQIYHIDLPKKLTKTR